MAASAVASRCPSTSRILLTCRAECSVSSTGLRPQIYSGMPFHLQKLAFPVNIASHKHPHTLESSLLVDLYCPLIKRIDEEMELFSSKSQAGFNEGQPQPLARQIWPHTQSNSNSLVLAVDAWFAAIPYQGRGAEIKETNQPAALVPHCIVGTAPVKFLREVFGVLRRVVDSVRLLVAPGPDGVCLNLVHELERELHCKYLSIARNPSRTREQPEQVAYGCEGPAVNGTGAMFVQSGQVGFGTIALVLSEAIGGV